MAGGTDAQGDGTSYYHYNTVMVKMRYDAAF